ncbi:MAG: AbrB/MazE/SpoVT family DNA-binding domain-containing protein [Bacilli bacterium]
MQKNNKLVNCGEVTVQDLGRVVIPNNIREKYGIQKGKHVELFIKIVED